MDKTDARTLSPQTQYELRKQVVRLRKKGITNKDTAQIVGINVSTASTIWQTFLRTGNDAIKPKARGRRHGAKRRLTPEQEAAIQTLLVDKTPDQLKLPFALWTRDAVRMAIRERYAIDMPLRTISDYLKRWGFTPQRPVKRAYEQNPKHVQRWLKTEYPAIAARARLEGAEIHWGDETGIQNDVYNARGFSPKGRAPVVRLNAKKFKLNMISTITNRGATRFMIYRDKMNAQMLIKFMARLIKDAKTKVFLILDNLRVHHAKKVTQWLESKRESIEVFYLPSYAPELNPDEYLNADLKGRIRSGLPPRSQVDLERNTRSFMKTLQRRPYHVQKYFKHPAISYAA